MSNSLDKTYAYDEYEKKEVVIYTKNDYLHGRNNIIVKLIIAISNCVIIAPFILLTAMFFDSPSPMLMTSLLCISSVIISYGLSFLLKKIHLAWKIIFLLIPCGLYGYVLGSTWYTIIIFTIVFYIMSNIILLECLKPALVALNTNRVIISLVSIGITQIIMRYTDYGEMHAIFNLLSIIWFIISMFVVARLSLHNISFESKDTKIPASLEFGTYFLVSLLSIASLVIAYIGPIKAFFENAFLWVVRLIFTIILFFSNKEQGEAPSDNADSSPMDMLSELGESSEPSMFAQILEKIVFGIVIIIFAYLLFLLFRTMFRAIRKLFNNIRNYLDELNSIPNGGYDDEEESSFNLDELSNNLKSFFNKVQKALTPKPKLSDMPNDEAKVRLLYRFMLEKLVKKETIGILSMTPEELLEHELSDTEKAPEFIQAYQKARYSNHKVEKTDISNGQKIIRKV